MGDRIVSIKLDTGRSLNIFNDDSIFYNEREPDILQEFRNFQEFSFKKDWCSYWYKKMGVK